MRPLRIALVSSLLALVPLAWPMAAASKAPPRPVTPEVHSLRLAGVDADAARGLRNSDDPAGRRLAARRDLRVLTAKTPTQRFELVGVTWRQVEATPELDVRVRTRSGSGGWSSWERLAVVDGERPDDGTGIRGVTEPVWTDVADGVQIAVSTPSASLPGDLRVMLVDPGESEADLAMTSPVSGAAASAATPMPDHLSREEWGADESLRHDDPEYGDTIVAGFVHHTATAADYEPEDSPGIVRSIYAYHTSNGWDDIGYNFLVDQYGQVFEGRYGGVDKPVIGGHTGGMNTDTFGVAALGNFEQRSPSGPLVDAVEQVAAYKLDMYGRDPEGTVDYQAPDGSTTTIDVLSGHRDVKATLCPGELLYAELPEIRRGTASRTDSDQTPPVAPGGDFDHDGYTDLVLRAPGEGIGPAQAAGSVTVVPGSSGGPAYAESTVWNQRSSGVDGAPEAGDRFGEVSTTGDFNGDSYDDLAIGVPFEVLGAREGIEQGHGAVHVLYGSADGLTAAGTEWLTIRQAGAGKDDGDRFGHTLAAGDTDADGFDELAVGVVGGGPDDGGLVVAYAGSAGGLETGSPVLYRSGSGLPADPIPSGDAPDSVGSALAMGDTDGDGTDDLAIGAMHADHADVEDAGAVFVLRGGPSGLDAGSVATFTQATAGVPGAPERSDGFGASLALGQLDGAFGFDLAVGVGSEGLAGRPRVGMVNVLYSSAGGLAGSDADGWHQDTSGVPGANERGDGFGAAALAAGDFDGDGIDDMAVSVRMEDIASRTDTGAVTVIPGGVDGLHGSGIRSWHQDTSGVPGVNEAGDQMGSSLAPVDLDTDGRDELAIGVRGENRRTGWVVLLPGSGSGLTSSGVDGVSQGTPGVPGSGERGDVLGS